MTIPISNGGPHTQEARIIAALSNSPNGLTTDQIATIINHKNPESLKTRLSKSFQYGKIRKTRTRRNDGTMLTMWYAGEARS